MNIKKILSILFLVTMLMVIMPLGAWAGKADVVSFGADLTEKQQAELLKEFGVSQDEVSIIKVSIQDVEEHLKGVATKKQIGTKAISSAHVKLLPKGKGLVVNTHNITWVTKEMYANAMVTAGVEDAEVQVAAPFKVTGTTALTGIMQAFETATGEKLTAEAKKAANEELVLTEEISRDIGKDEAVKLMGEIKNEIAKREIKSPEDIRQVIMEIADKLDLKLSKEQVDQILGLMEKISKLDLNIDKISKQLDKISSNLEIVKKTVEENKGILQRILTAISNWLKSIFG